MADPFQDVDAAGEAFIKIFADAMDERQSDPTMEAIVAAYLDLLQFDQDTITIEVGAGAGAVTRRIAAKAAPAQVTGYEPSAGFVAEARARAAAHDNLSFEVANGTALPLEDDSVDHVIMHTVLTHVTDPAALLTEAYRVLKPQGILVVCDCDFSKGSLASFGTDPLDACARAFVANFVTDAHIVSKMRNLAADAGLAVTHFDMASRVVNATAQMLPWVSETTKQMVAKGQIGQELATALVNEYSRRQEAGTLFGYQAFATMAAAKP